MYGIARAGVVAAILSCVLVFKALYRVIGWSVEEEGKVRGGGVEMFNQMMSEGMVKRDLNSMHAPR